MVVKNGTFGNDLLVGTNNADTLIGSFGNDLLRGLGGNDTLDGGGDNDTLEGGAGNDSLFGGGGTDTMLFDTNTSVTLSAAAGVVTSAGLGTDTFDSVENVTTGSGADAIFFNNSSNVISTGGGADTVFASGGNDIVDGGDQADSLYGEAGHDTLNGGDGNDTLNGGAGLDELFGGSGNDTAVFDTTDDVTFAQADNYAESALLGFDEIYSIENVTTGSGDDEIAFDSDLNQSNVVNAGAGNDFISTFGGADTVNGGNDDDLVYAGAGNDTVNGGSGADDLYGWTGNDTINGGNNADLIVGGDDVDTLTGGAGADKFRFFTWETGVGAGNRDIVMDFSQAQGDELDLSFIVDLDYIGQNAFTAEGQVRWSQSGGDTIVAINYVGATGADMQIQLEGNVNLVEGDFIL